MRELMATVTAVVLLVSAGCVSTSFVQTDPKFRPQGGVSPDCFVDRRPSRPYRSVGIIEVASGGGPLSLEAALEAATGKGRELGCDLVIDRALHVVGRVGPRIAQVGLVPGLVTYVPARPSGGSAREFICGIYLSSTAPTPASSPR